MVSGRWVRIGLGVLLLLLLVRLAGVRVAETPTDPIWLPDDDRDIRVYVLYGGADQAADQFMPGGWKWDMTMIQLNAKFREKPNAAASCIEIAYQPLGPPQEGTVEIFWQLPESVWGDNPGGKLPESSRLVFKARGRKGGEQAEFQAGGLGSATMASTGVINLTGHWQEYEISLTDLEVSHLSDGFCFRAIIPRQRARSTFYLDDIRLEVGRTEELYIPADPEDDEIKILSISASQT